MLALTDSQFKADIPPKPKVLPIQFENIPSELKARRRWVVWRCEVRQDKKGRWNWTKVPYQACPPPPDEVFWPKAKSNDPSTWASYDAALQTYLEGPGWDGIGFMLGDDHAGVDCDKCIDPAGTVEPWAEEVVRQINSYTEISPSGTGGKILALGKLPEGRRRTGSLEMYSETRFFAVTGHWLPGTPKTVEPRQNQLLQLHARVFPQDRAKGNGKEQRKKDHAHAERNGHLHLGVEKEPPTLKAALRLFLKRICDYYGDHRAVKKHPSKQHTYQCRCPAHDDSTPSLSVTIKKNRLVFHCLATSKCGFKEILKALDFRPQWCFAPVTVKRLAKAKKLPAEFLASLGCKDWHRQVVIPYYDGHSHKVCVRRRVALKKRKGQGPTTYQQKGKPLHIYGEWPDKLIPRSDEVVFVEGETDTWTLWFHGIPALGIPGATAGKVIEQRHLKGLKRVYLWQEPDEAGAGFVAGVLGRLRFLKFTGDVLVLKHGKYKDPNDLHVGESDFKAAWQDVVAQARKGGEVQAQEPQGRELPVIYVSNRQLVDIRHDAVAALKLANQPPKYFQRAGCVSRLWVNPETKRPAFEPLSSKALRGVLAEIALWKKKTRDSEASVIVPDYVADDLASHRHLDLPPVRTIVEAPFFTASGRLVVKAGYDPESMYYYHAPSLVLPPVPEKPTLEDINQAKRLLFDDLLVDFPFSNESSRANVLAFLLLGFLRPLINGPTPFHLIDAPSPGTGKDLLAGCFAILTTGKPASTKSESHGEEEWKKNLTSILGEGPSYVYFENVNYALSSATLAKCLTGRVHRDRVLGRNDQEREMPVDCVWIGTGNNVRASGEIARRMVKIRIDACMEAPETRTRFKHPLPRWVFENRGPLIAACLTLIRAWVAQGMPREQPVCMLGSFEDWCYIMAGMMKVIGVDGFLANRLEDVEATNSSSLEWREFVQRWAMNYQTGSVTATELCEMCRSHKLLFGTVFHDIANFEDVHRFKTKLGIALGNHKDRVFGTWQIKIEQDSHSKSSRYCLHDLAGEVK